jgi:integrase
MKLNLVPQALPGLTETEREGIVTLARMVLADLHSPNSERMYGIRLKQFFRTGLPLTREGVSTWLNSHRDWSAATAGQAISIMRKLVREAELRELIDPREARGILAIPCRPNRGVRHGNWLGIEDVRALIAAPGPTWEGKRDRVVLALLTGCGLRRTEAVNLNWSQYQARDGRMCLVDVVGKGQKLRTIPVPQWVEEIIETWREVAPNQREPWQPGMEPKTIDAARKARIWEARETLERRMTEIYLELVPKPGRKPAKTSQERPRPFLVPKPSRLLEPAPEPGYSAGQSIPEGGEHEKP